VEIWKDIPEYENCYQASNLGNIRSLGRKVNANSSFRFVEGQLLRQKVSTKGGYLLVTLSVCSVAKTYTVHSLIMRAFIGDRPEGLAICHNDGNSANNCLSNLRYDTNKNNHQDKINQGKTARGAGINTSRLTDDQVVEMRNRRFLGETLQSLADHFRVSNVSVSKICLGENWKYAGGPLSERQRRKQHENQTSY
jgi:hypothetical protein